jgi:O-succinylbenzoic acid--CoA ligase
VPGLLQVLKRFDAILIGGQKPKTQTIDRLRAMGINLVITYGMAETGGGVIYDGVPLRGVDVSITEDGRIRIGSLITNDLGELVEGKLVVSGRVDRVIISGGHKLALEAVEDWTFEQRGVADAAAVSVAHPEFGEAFVCFYTLTSSDQLDTSRAALALGIVAKSGTWRRLEKLPTLPSGKPDLQFLGVMANQLGETFE